ncbi:hypothetical protein Hanom_Chr17g01530861 [Helianthus anomalus]
MQILKLSKRIISTRPVNEPNAHEHNFNLTRTYNRTHVFVRVRSLRNWECSCSFV